MISRTLQLVVTITLSCAAVSAQDQSDPAYRTAVHEASHGVAILALGGRVKEMEIADRVHPSGMVSAGLTSAESSLGDEANAMVDIAGMIGTHLLLGIPLPQPTFPGTGTDFDHALQHAGANFMALAPQTETLIYKHRARVMMIAAALHKTRYLTGAQVETLYHAALAQAEEPPTPNKTGEPQVPPTQNVANGKIGKKERPATPSFINGRNVISLGLILGLVWLIFRYRRALPIHEAGHAVATLAQDGTLDRIETHIDHGACFGYHPDSKKDAVICCAGVAAQDVCGAHVPESLLWRNSSDYDQAVKLVGEDGIPAAQAEAKRICADHQAEIELIANELGANGYMSGARARQLFQRPAKERAREQRRQESRERHRHHRGLSAHQQLPSLPGTDQKSTSIGEWDFTDRYVHAAFHEASHTVVALAKGYRFKHARIIASGAYPGGVTSIGENENEMGGCATLYLAGYAGEAYFCGDTAHWVPEGSPDYQTAERVAGPNFREWLPEAEALIARHQAAIELIARELHEKREIKADRAWELFVQADERRHPARTAAKTQRTRRADTLRVQNVNHARA